MAAGVLFGNGTLGKCARDVGYLFIYLKDSTPLRRSDMTKHTLTAPSISRREDTHISLYSIDSA